MTDEKLTTICFMGTEAIKTQLEQWAADDDRSVSYILRRILKQEIKRRQQSQQKSTKQ